MNAHLAPYAVAVDWKNPPRLVFLAIEVSLEYVAPEVAKLCEAVFEVYLVDPSSRTYCCELTPSFHLRHVTTTAWPKADASESEAEEVDEAFRYNGDDSDAYVHVWQVAGGHYGTPIATYTPDDPEETLEESTEYALEWYQGNPKL